MFWNISFNTIPTSDIGFWGVNGGWCFATFDELGSVSILVVGGAPTTAKNSCFSTGAYELWKDFELLIKSDTQSIGLVYSREDC